MCSFEVVGFLVQVYFIDRFLFIYCISHTKFHQNLSSGSCTNTGGETADGRTDRRNEAKKHLSCLGWTRLKMGVQTCTGKRACKRVPENGRANVHREKNGSRQGKWAAVVRKVMNFRLTQQRQIAWRVGRMSTSQWLFVPHDRSSVKKLLFYRPVNQDNWRIFAFRTRGQSRGTLQFGGTSWNLIFSNI